MRGTRGQGLREPDPELLAKVIEASINGRGVFLPGVEAQLGGVGSGGPLAGGLYRFGYNIHQRQLEGGFAVWSTRGIVRGDSCGAVYDLVDRIAGGLSRLRQRGRCPAWTVAVV